MAVTWKQFYQHVWNQVHMLKWLPGYSKDISIAEDGKTLDHLPGLRYACIRTKQGFARGVHYWTAQLKTCTIEGFNSYIGVALEDVPNSNYLGSTDRKYQRDSIGGSIAPL
jgi:hypothetical protein